MSQKTGIEWCDATLNPIRGCTRISRGCEHCYAERMAARFSGMMGDPSKPRETTAPFFGFIGDTGKWTGRVELIESQLEIPLHWKKPRLIFVNSMSDLFHEALPNEAIDRVFAVMALCPQHTFLVLTKRVARMSRWFSEIRCEDGEEEPTRYCAWERATETKSPNLSPDDRRLILKQWEWPLSNVWLGISVEDRAHKDRIDALRETPAALRFLSLEPLLEDLGELDLREIDWVICGGESGPGARPAHPDWFRSARDQCVETGVPFFFKQWGEWAPARLETVEGAINKTGGRYHWIFDPECKGSMRRLGKRRVGRLLDGREWNEMPEVRP